MNGVDGPLDLSSLTISSDYVSCFRQSLLDVIGRALSGIAFARFMLLRKDIVFLLFPRQSLWQALQTIHQQICRCYEHVLGGLCRTCSTQYTTFKGSIMDQPSLPFKVFGVTSLQRRSFKKCTIITKVRILLF